MKTSAALAASPDWPVVMTTEAAVLYLGGRECRLFGLIAAGYLSPWHQGHKDTDFLRAEIDTALKVARLNGDTIEIDPKIRTVAAAVELREQRKTAA